MKDIWNKDPAVWRSMPLSLRLEEMRRWHCTGPSGQCAASMKTRTTLASTIKDAQEVVVREDQLRTELLSALLEASDYDELYKHAMELVDPDRPYPEGIAFDEAWRQRQRADAAEALTAWITDRPPSDCDVHEDANSCVEVTYTNGMIGWEPIWNVKKWEAGDDSEVVAWRKIGPSYKSA